MRKIFIWAILCVMAIALAVAIASAYPSYATATGKPCGYCHIDPKGGGPLTAAGQYYLDNGRLGPLAPTSLTATAASSTQINLAWTE